MANKMLIDAAHPEETRVVVLRGNRVEEFDFESASKKQLRGNIYLAKVTRVEPSLQAAFVEYGGNRHGFLAFSEIHPDYYQIPVADRQALLEDEAHSQEDEEDEPRSNGHRRSRRNRRGGGQQAEKRGASSEGATEAPAGEGTEHDGTPNPDHAHSDTDAAATSAASTDDILPEQGFGDTDPVREGSVGLAEPSADAEAGPTAADASDSEPNTVEAVPLRAEHDGETISEEVREPIEDLAGEADAGPAGSDDEDQEADERDGDVTTLEHGYEAAPHDGETDEAPSRENGGEPGGEGEDDGVEQLGGDALEDVPSRVARPRRHYKIQEVIKRRQVLLVQVVKEERGNKGAALTTYLSLAGRYSVLMPNTARGGGISRKITDAEDRKRLKAIAQELEVPEGMGIILRTAGAARGIQEVKRDFEYLMRMWETVRETTLKSSAPMLVYEEGSLIKRAIRDLYSKEIDEITVAGDEAYKEAHDFMRLLMPSHTKNVIAYRDPQPLFAKSGVEAQLDAMFSNHVVLRSGGYLVINQTEALVAIDVNSGRSTREHNIEDTALRTNLEAADEIARQLRLRDLAGLIVVDFIDMEEGRNDRAVERRIKDALKDDRARIQIGRISHFGLLEMSRQRIRTGVLEGSTVVCPHCGGGGMVRSVSSIALHILRLLEDTLIKSASHNLTVRTRAEVALYVLNQKRSNLLDLEARFGVSITVVSDPLMTGMIYHAIERGTEATPPVLIGYRPGEARTDSALLIEDEEELEGAFPDDTEEESTDEALPVQARDGQNGNRSEGEGEGDGSRRRKRRRRRRGRDTQQQPYSASEGQPSDAGLDRVADPDQPAGAEFEPGEDDEAGEEMPFATAEEASAGADLGAEPVVPTLADPGETSSDGTGARGSTAAAPSGEAAVEAPRRRRSRRSKVDDPATPDVSEEVTAATRRPRRSRAKTVEASSEDETDQTRPSADRDVGADTVKHHPADATAGGSQPELPLVETVARAAEPAKPSPEVSREPELAPAGQELEAKAADVVPEREPESDPNRPKRSGWWQRAKATFTTGS